MKFLSALSLLIIMSPLGSVSFAADSNPEVNAAKTVAENWLALVDAKKYDDSWKEAATLFKSKVNQKTWASAAEQARGPLGKLIRREFLTSNVATSLPGAPDGKYVVLQFKTTFQNKREAVETITPMLDKDGKWHVSGYFVK